MGVARENHEYRVPKDDERQRKDEQQKKQDLVAKAARMEALDAATDEILKAAKNLEKEVRRETKYWQEIVSISDKGWPIHRLGRTFAVRYGLPEGTEPTIYKKVQSLTTMQLVIISKPAALLLCAWTKMAVLSLIRIFR
jgi:hypothetical protein